MTETTAPHLMKFVSGSQMPQKCFGNCCRVERSREGGRNVLNPAGKSEAASAQGLGRSKVQGFLQPRCKYFAWLSSGRRKQQAADGHAFIHSQVSLAVLEAKSFWMGMGSCGELAGLLSRGKRRTGTPAALTRVDGAEHWLDHAS